MTVRLVCSLVLGFMLLTGSRLLAADNELTPEQKKDGWILLFDGTLKGWTTNTKKESRTPVEENAINPHRSGGYMMIHENDWKDFILALDFKISPKCNSGIFIRTFPLEPRPGKDVGFNGIEIAIDDTTSAGMHDTGAIYDLVPPKKNAMKPVGEWNHMEITAKGGHLSVNLNGEEVTTADLDQWTRKNTRPDGSRHKFDIAFKDHPRHGYIGLQDHGSPCWFKNIRLKVLE